MQQHNFELIYRKGKQNVVADMLSRSIKCIEILALDEGNNISDAKYVKLRKDIERNNAKYKQYKIADERIYKYMKSFDDPNQTTYVWKVLVAEGERNEILETYHDSPIGAHLGYYKTLRKIQQKHYWPGMNNDVKNYIMKCTECQLNKHPNKKTKVPMGDAKAPNRPWQMIAIDFMGPFPRSKQGNKYIFVVLDVFSKFVLLFPMRHSETNCVIRVLEENIFLIFGVPSVVISDNGPQFHAHVFQNFLREYKVKQFLNSAYHAQNNPAERINRVVLASIRAYIKHDQRNWDTYLAKIGCAIRTAEHSSSKYSPYFVNFGRPMKISGEVDKLNDESIDPGAMSEKMKQVHDLVKVNLERAQDKYRHHYDLRTRPIEFTSNEVVLKRNFQISDATRNYNAKLGPQWMKCIVIRKIGNCTYELKDESGKNIGKFHANDLRKFYD